MLADWSGAVVCIVKWPVFAGYYEHAFVCALCQARDDSRSALAGARSGMGTFPTMTESAAPRPPLRRTRLIAGAVVLVLILAVAGLVLWVFEGNSTGALKVHSVRSEKSEDGVANLAVLLVTNQTKRDYSVFLDRKWWRAFGRIVPRCPTGSVEAKRPSATNAITWPLPSFSESEYEVQVPEDGQEGHLALYCERQPKKLPRVLNEARKLMYKVYKPPHKSMWALSDQEIQCPRVLADGTVEPPRLLPAPKPQP